MNNKTQTAPAAEPATFSTDTSNLEDCLAPALVELADGDTFDLRIAPVAKTLGDCRVRMLAYNGSIPGPTLRVPQGAEVGVRVRNDADVEATVHWHGLRLDNGYDGVPHETQAPIPVGGEFTYRVRFPDPGLYWYHPHIREDYGLDMGLYGCLVVVPAEDSYWPPVNREVVVTLDDVLIEDGRIAPFHHAGPTHVAMGRFGNVMLTGGQASFQLEAQVGEIVVGEEAVEQSFLRDFEQLRTSAEMTAERARADAERERPPDKTLAFESLMPLLYGDQDTAASSWTCPMHPDVATAEPGTCPACGMRLIPQIAGAGGSSGHSHGHDSADGLEWEDLMPEINRASDSSNMIWKLVDRDTGKENWEIEWAFRVGDRVKIRLVNDMEQDHPMHHPFHIHGAGRFLVISRDGEAEPNLAWKDTVLVRTGETVDMVLEVSNPGLWMAHCHIAEHNQSGMMFSFPVYDKGGS